MNITVLYTLPTRRSLKSQFSETDVDTEDSASEVATALRELDHTVTLAGIDEDHITDIANIQADCIFNLIDWTGLDLPFSDTAFQELEKTGIPFTGATRENYLATSDKAEMKKLLDASNLPTARWQVFENGHESVREDFRYPVIVKLAKEHCSIGLDHDAVVPDKDALVIRVRERLKTYKQAILAEEFLEGREFQVTAFESPDGVRVLPPAEIVYRGKKSGALLTYESRWDETHPDYKTSSVTVPTLDAQLNQTIVDLTKETFTSLGFRDYTRLDLRMRGNDVFILEANSNPGLSDDDEYGMTVSYRAVGLTFRDLIGAILTSTMKRGLQTA